MCKVNAQDTIKQSCSSVLQTVTPENLFKLLIIVKLKCFFLLNSSFLFYQPGRRFLDCLIYFLHSAYTEYGFILNLFYFQIVIIIFKESLMLQPNLLIWGSLVMITRMKRIKLNHILTIPSQTKKPTIIEFFCSFILSLVFV